MEAKKVFFILVMGSIEKEQIRSNPAMDDEVQMEGS